MKNEELNNDKLLRDKLNEFSLAPPPMVWDNIKNKLAARKRKKRLAYISWISAAAVVLLAFIAGWYFNNTSNKNMPLSAEQQTVNQQEQVTSPETENGKTGNIISERIEDQENELQTPEENQKRNLANEIVDTNLQLTSNNTNIDKHSDQADEASVEERRAMKLLMALLPEMPEKVTEEGLAERSDQSDENVLNEVDNMLIAANLKTIKSERKNEKGWIMGMHVSPGYSSFSSSHTETYAESITYSDESNGANVGGGLSIQYKTSKRLRIESGLYYSQGGQSSRNSYDLLALDNSSKLNSNDLGFEFAGDIPTSFSNAVSIRNGNIAMNTTAGVIEMKSTPKGAEIAADVESSANGLANRLVSNGEFSQVFDFVEIPLYVRYSILESKFGLEVLGGLNAGLVVGNNAYINNNAGLQNIGKTQDISTLNISGTLGIGLNYAIGKQFSLAVEPRINYYLNSINSDPAVEFRPYRVGVYTGIYYEF